jgi:orotidine-5'-phosphate decarboxylase
MPELILALDVKTLDESRRILDLVGPRLNYVKIGPRLFILGGPAFLEEVRSRGYQVFLDLKLHDIPNTVALGVEAMAGLGLWALTLHVSGGRAMLRAAKEARDKAGGELKLFGVTVLTSLDDQAWLEVAPGASSVAQAVARRAAIAAEEGLEGLVCSPRELARVREVAGDAIWTIVPGIRPASAVDDQRRTATAAWASAAGADFLVVGRPILKAADPAEAVNHLLHEIREAQ